MGDWCVGACIKHFPGIGAVPVDTHEELPTIELSETEMARHLQVFEELSEEIPVVMVGHVIVPSLGDAERPASLSRTVIERAASLPGSPVVLSDDLEMGALAGWGELPELVIEALRARNHGVLVCKAFDQLDMIAEAIEVASEDEDGSLASRLSQHGARLGTLRRELCHHAASVPAPDDATVEQLWEKARREAEP
jgi:beta-N-acetylhexosaminidase